MASDLLQVDRHHLAVVDEPGTFFHFDLVVKLPLDDGGVTLQTHSEGAPLDVHHHVPALDAEVDVEGHGQLQGRARARVKGQIKNSESVRIQ